jgi:hypothetical protein
VNAGTAAVISAAVKAVVRNSFIRLSYFARHRDQKNKFSAPLFRGLRFRLGRICRADLG